MTKICLIIHSLGIGGMERVMSQLANDFAKRKGIQVDILLIGKKRIVAYSIDSSITIHRPSFSFKESRRKFDTVRTILFLRRKVKELSPDTVLSFGEMWNNLVLLSLYGLDYPIYISDRSEPGKDLGKIQNFLRGCFYPHAAGYIAQTSEAKKECQRKGWNTNIEIIGNPIREIPSGEQDQKENIVLTVGRLIKTKHIDQLIRMFVEIGNPEWKLVIVGGDAKKLNLLEQYEKLVKDLGVEDRVFLKGQQENVDYYYRKSKIFAFTSSSEGFPNVIGEALSAGLPVISYDCIAGPSDMIEDGRNGYLIPLFDRTKFKQKLQLMMKSSELRDKFRKNSKRDIQKYSVEKVSEKFFQFIMGMRG